MCVCVCATLAMLLVSGIERYFRLGWEGGGGGLSNGACLCMQAVSRCVEHVTHPQLPRKRDYFCGHFWSKVVKSFSKAVLDLQLNKKHANINVTFRGICQPKILESTFHM